MAHSKSMTLEQRNCEKQSEVCWFLFWHHHRTGLYTFASNLWHIGGFKIPPRAFCPKALHAQKAYAAQNQMMLTKFLIITYTTDCLLHHGICLRNFSGAYVQRLQCTGHILYHGPREQIMRFFQGLGFDKPERKGIPDFLQEVSGLKDQEVSVKSLLVSTIA